MENTSVLEDFVKTPLLSIALLALCFDLCAQQEKQPAGPPPPITIRPQQQPPPPLPKVPDVRQPGETGISIGVMGWFPVQAPTIDKGKGADWTIPTNTRLAGKPKVSPEGDVGIALGLHNALRVSYFQDRASGNANNGGNDVRIWDKVYPAGALVATDYKIQGAKISFDYLTWPYPVESRKFRLKTLWQIQYLNINTRLNAPLLPVTDASGNALVDATGNPLDYHSQGSKSIILPTLGIGLAEYVTRHVRLEANGSGFAIPHHSTIWDGDASANFRYGHWELRLGARAFHFKTSTQSDFYLKNTMASAFVGLRWYSQ